MSRKSLRDFLDEKGMLTLEKILCIMIAVIEICRDWKLNADLD